MMTQLIDIILVEDNLSDAELAIRAFRRFKSGLNVIHIKDGEEAIAFIDKIKNDGNKYPRLFVLDINMPKVSGLQVLQYIKSDYRTATIPVVMLTSSREEKDVEEGYGLGANSFVVKPVDFDSFMAVVGDIASYWLRLNQIPV